MELDALVAEIAKFSDKDALTAALKAKVQPVYQSIFNDGHAVATAASGQKLTKLQAKLDETKTELETVKTTLSATPDVAKLEAAYNGKISKLEKKIEEQKAEFANEKKVARRTSAIQSIEKQLAAKVDDTYAESLVSRDSFKERITVDEQGNVRIMQNGQQIPFAGSEPEQIAAVVEELMVGVKPIFLKSTVERGPGKPGEGGAAGSGGNKAKYDAIREAAQKKGAGQMAPEERRAALNKRMGVSA